MASWLRSVRSILASYLVLLDSARSKLPWLWLMIVGASLLDVLGVGLVVPFIAVVTNPDYLKTASWAEPLADFTAGWPHENVVLFLGALFLGGFVLKFLVSVALYAYSASFAYGQDAAIRTRALSRFMFAPYEFHLAHDRARIIATLIENTSRFSSSLLSLLRLLSECVIVIVVLGLLLWVSPIAVLLLAVFIGLTTFIYLRLLGKRAGRWGTAAIVSNREIVKFTQEALEGLKEIRTLGVERHFIRGVSNSATTAARVATKSLLVSIFPRYFMEVSLVAFVVAFVVISLRMGGTASDVIPLLALFGVAGLRLLPSVSSILSSVAIVRYSLPAVKQLCADLELAPAPAARIGAKVTAPEKFEELSLQHVYFTYAGSERQVICDVSLDVRARQAIGIVGSSGAGKTTLIDLILGLLVPQRGVVSVNGIPVTDDLDSWWSMVAYIPQSVFLSDDTIRRNIALGLTEDLIDEDKIDGAIEAAQLGEFIRELPGGKGTVVGDHGIRLSGGQRQRIAIARALYFDRQVFIFDEATSALDSKTEAEIVSAIGALRGSKTMIVIAHRLSTLAYCDRVIALNRGQIVGEYASIYEVESDLAQRQMESCDTTESASLH